MGVFVEENVGGFDYVTDIRGIFCSGTEFHIFYWWVYCILKQVGIAQERNDLIYKAAAFFDNMEPNLIYKSTEIRSQSFLNQTYNMIENVSDVISNPKNTLHVFILYLNIHTEK